MNYIVCKIVNKNGLIIETVAYNEETNSIYMYELSESEHLIKEEIPASILKPKWSFEQNKWVENATEEESEAKEQEKLEKEKEQKEQEEIKEVEENLSKTLLRTVSDLQLEVTMLKTKGDK